MELETRLTLDQKIEGSNPSGSAMKKKNTDKIDELVNLIDTWYNALLKQEIKKLKEKEHGTNKSDR